MLELSEEEKKEKIKIFLEGHDDQKYITHIEPDYRKNEVYLFIDDPEKGKSIIKDTYKPFTFVRDFKQAGKTLYENKRLRDSAMSKHGINIKKLRTDGNNRLENGYKYIVHSDKDYSDLQNFFQYAGHPFYNKKFNLVHNYEHILSEVNEAQCHKYKRDLEKSLFATVSLDEFEGETEKEKLTKKKMFIEQTLETYKVEQVLSLFAVNPPQEQYLIQTGKRHFKGFSSYSQIHKFFFDIETTSLKAEEGNIFLIGMKDNRGFRKVLAIDPKNPIESEKQMIIDFFNTIIELRPSIVAGYNSEAFDFTFILKRAEILGVNLGVRTEEGMMYDVRTSLHPEFPLKRKQGSLKFGGETENYEQTIMWGISVIDISHAVRKTMAINSEIKGWGLKYITQWAEVAKENRMYVQGDKIYKIWNENKMYFINTKNNNYHLIPENFQDNPQKYKEMLIHWFNNGQAQITKYFDSAESIDIISGSEIVFQYLIDDLEETEAVDTRFNESAFMLGAITPTSFVRTSTMGNASLWRLIMTTYSYENGLAIPKPDKKRNIVGGLSRLYLTGFGKNMIKKDFKSLYPSIEITHDIFPECDITGALKTILTFFRSARVDYQKLSAKYEAEGDAVLANFYNTKQLPIKILTNSLFGGLSSPEIFPWGDNDIGEATTCFGRQYLRMMVDHYISYGFKPVILDTDGCNFLMPDNIDEIVTYDEKGEPFRNPKTGEILTGYPAVLAQFNSKMTGVMWLEEDGICARTINFSRKNYVNLSYKKDKVTGELKGKIKLTGATIKSKTIQSFVSEFLDEGLKMLLNSNGKGFLNSYYEYISKIYNRQIPLAKIANKSKVKLKIEDYKIKMTKKNAKGGSLPKQAHMELLIANDMDANLGEVIYYVNNGLKKSHGDVGNAYIIKEYDIVNNPDQLGEYNIEKYLDVFNKKVKPLLVCFKPEIRKDILITNPEKRPYFTDLDLEMVNGQPIKPEDQDCLYLEDYDPKSNKNEPLFEMSENEVKFWNRTGYDPKMIFSGFSTELSRVKLYDDVMRAKLNILKAVIRDELGYSVRLDDGAHAHGDKVLLPKDDSTFQLYESVKGDLVPVREFVY